MITLSTDRVNERILDTDPRLEADFPGFGRYGCNARATLGLTESFVGAPLTLDQLKDALAQMRNAGLLGPEWAMDQERSFRETIAIAARLFSRPRVTGEQVGRVYAAPGDKNRIAFWGGWGSWTACIKHYNSQSVDGHYVEGDRWLRDVFDPTEGVQITTVREILLYRLEEK